MRRPYRQSRPIQWRPFCFRNSLVFRKSGTSKRVVNQDFGPELISVAHFLFLKIAIILRSQMSLYMTSSKGGGARGSYFTCLIINPPLVVIFEGRRSLQVKKIL